MSIPHLFRCPISLDLFTDPVTLCTGQTYDRPSIEKWIASGNLTCPVTMLRLHDLSMVPNHTLSHLIRQWLDQTDQSPLLLGTDHDHDHNLAALKKTLESEEPIWEKKLRALKQVKALSLDLHCAEHDGLIRFGFFPLVLELAFHRESTYTQQRLELVELALNTAFNLLPFSNLGCLNMLKEEANLASLSALLEQGTPLIKITLCHLMEVVLSPPNSFQQTKELSFKMRNSIDIQRSIISLILPDHNNNKDDENVDDEEEEQDNAEVSEAGVKVVLALCSICVDHNHPDSLEKLVQLGAVNSLVKYISRAQNTDRGLGQGAAVAALEVLLAAECGKEALLGESDGVKALVKMVFRVCDHHGSESAVSSLMGLCCGSAEAREEAVKAGVLTQLLLLLQSQCSGRAKTKARILLKMLGSRDHVG